MIMKIDPKVMDCTRFRVGDFIDVIEGKWRTQVKALAWEIMIREVDKVEINTANFGCVYMLEDQLRRAQLDVSFERVNFKKFKDWWEE